jgi:hypothetical protein
VWWWGAVVLGQSAIVEEGTGGYAVGDMGSTNNVSVWPQDI